MTIVLVGLNHRTAPVEVRERVAFTEEDLPRALRRLVDGEILAEGLILSTCNRVELLAVTRHAESVAYERLQAVLRDHARIPALAYEDRLYRYADREAVRHLFRVTAGLDSMVVGEPQIFGQVKEAYARAVEVGTIGKTLHLLLPRAFSVAKRVRTETAIGTSPVSVSSIAVELARRIFEDLSEQTILLIGAGKMAELALRHLLWHGSSRVLICNRTRERAAHLAEQFARVPQPITRSAGDPVGAPATVRSGPCVEAFSLDDLPTILARADIVLCSVGGTEYVLRREHVLRALSARRNRPLFLIDISVPRTVEPSVGRLENVFLYDIDDLEQIAQANLARRHAEAARAEQIVEHAVDEFFKSLRSLEAGPVIAAFRRRLEEIAYGELERHRRYLGSLTPEQERALRHLLEGIIAKFAHPAIVRLHEIVRQGERHLEELTPMDLWGDALEEPSSEGRSNESSTRWRLRSRDRAGTSETPVGGPERSSSRE